MFFHEFRSIDVICQAVSFCKDNQRVNFGIFLKDDIYFFLNDTFYYFITWMACEWSFFRFWKSATVDITGHWVTNNNKIFTFLMFPFIILFLWDITMIMNCFYGMADRRKRLFPLQVSSIPRAEPVLNLSSASYEWSYWVVIHY